jgi:hypothetical protein
LGGDIYERRKRGKDLSKVKGDICAYVRRSVQVRYFVDEKGDHTGLPGDD